MKFEEWWAKQTANFDPEEGELMQLALRLARVTWHAAQEIKREECAELLEQQHTWISNVEAANLVRTHSNVEE